MIFPVSSDLFLAQGHRIIASSEVVLLIVLSDTPKSQGQSWEWVPLVSSPGPGPLLCSCKELQLLLDKVHAPPTGPEKSTTGLTPIPTLPERCPVMVPIMEFTHL